MFEGICATQLDLTPVTFKSELVKHLAVRLTQLLVELLAVATLRTVDELDELPTASRYLGALNFEHLFDAILADTTVALEALPGLVS